MRNARFFAKPSRSEFQNSTTTVKLVITAMREMDNNPKVGHADALRRAMLVLIEKGKPEEAHPAYWAPFIVVGEGMR